MRALITGASGFVGQYLIRELLASGYSVSGGSMDGIPLVLATLTREESARVHWVELDVTSDDSLRAAVERARPDRVYHLAGQSSVGGSFADPLGTWEVNATGALRLLHVVRTSGLPPGRVLIVSSAEVYGSPLSSGKWFCETDPLRPASPYAASKAAAEMVGIQCARAGTWEVVVARSFNHTGPGQDPRFALPSFARQLARIAAGECEPVLQVGNLEARRDFLDVRDVVRAYRCLLEQGENGGTYNVCSGEARPLSDLLDELIELSGARVRVEIDPDRVRPVDVPLLVGNPDRLRGLGWRPEIPLRTTLADLFQAARHATH